MSDRRYWLLALGVAMAIGCGEDYETVVAAIMLDHDAETLEATVPGRVTAGVPFEVEFSTWGGDCDKPIQEEIQPREGGVLITPFERHYLGGCISILIEYPRRVEVVFEEPGSRTVAIRGRPTTLLGGELVIAEHTVTVEE